MVTPEDETATAAHERAHANTDAGVPVVSELVEVRLALPLAHVVL
jgi:hypothetical protein